MLIIIALFAPNELAAPGLASVNVATFPAASLIVPPLSANESVATSDYENQSNKNCNSNKKFKKNLS